MDTHQPISERFTKKVFYQICRKCDISWADRESVIVNRPPYYYDGLVNGRRIPLTNEIIYVCSSAYALCYRRLHKCGVFNNHTHARYSRVLYATEKRTDDLRPLTRALLARPLCC